MNIELPPLPERIKDLIDQEMVEYSDGAYADHGSARDQLEWFARAAIEAHEARKVPDGWRSFVERVAGQKPEKPDYWSACGQCEHNISDAEDLLASAPPAPQASVVQEPVAWMWQHDETGREGFVSAWQLKNGWQENNPRLKVITPLYPHPAPVREPLTIQEVEQINARWNYELHGDRLRFVV